MSSLFILLFIIAAIVSAPLLIVMLVVKLTEAEHKKEKIKKIAEENKQPDKKNAVIAHLTAALQHFNSPDQHKDLSSNGLSDKQQPITGKNSVYVPNHIPSAVRTESAVLALFLIGYGVVAWFLDGMYLPAKRGGFVIHGLALNLMVLAMICAALNLVAIVVDHYDRRNNERHYINFSKVTRFLGWTLFAMAFAADVFNVGN